MRILVTGGAGFIGSHTCLVLMKNGHELLVIDSFINSNSLSLEKVGLILHSEINDFKEKLKIIEGDIRDIEIINNIFLNAKKINKPIDAVLHFAGLKSVKESFEMPLDYWDVNICGTVNLLKVMKKYECKTIVFSSSAAIYKKSNEFLIKEDYYIEPSSPYGLTKHNVEIILKNIFHNDYKDWRIACLRYFNPIGAHRSGIIGECSSVIPNNLFPFINLVAIGKIKEVKIFGNDWPTSDGTGIRDYIHVMDLAEGHFETLKFLIKSEPQFLTLNLGTGQGTSVLDLIKTFSKVNKVNIPYSYVERRKGDQCRVVADISLSKSILKWEAKRNLEQMCKDGWNWQLNNPDGY